MNYLLYPLIILAFSSVVSAQELQTDSLGYETFVMDEGDTSYVMKKYFMAFLKAGPKRDQTPEQVAKIQKGHMDNMALLAHQKKTCNVGPLGGDCEIRGIKIFNVPTPEEVERLIALDPAVITERRTLEVHPWWAAKESTLE